MNLSGILVVVSPQDIESAVHALNGLSGVEVYQSDLATGRIVVTQEAETVDKEVEGLSHIRSLPSVLSAEMVYHYVGDDFQPITEIPPELDRMTGLSSAKAPSDSNT